MSDDRSNQTDPSKPSTSDRSKAEPSSGKETVVLPATSGRQVAEGRLAPSPGLSVVMDRRDWGDSEHDAATRDHALPESLAPTADDPPPRAAAPSPPREFDKKATMVGLVIAVASFGLGAIVFGPKIGNRSSSATAEEPTTPALTVSSAVLVSPNAATALGAPAASAAERTPLRVSELAIDPTPPPAEAIAPAPPPAAAVMPMHDGMPLRKASSPSAGSRKPRAASMDSRTTGNDVVDPLFTENPGY